MDWKNENKSKVLGQKAKEGSVAASTCLWDGRDEENGAASPPMSSPGSRKGRGSDMGEGHLSPWPTAPGAGLEPQRERGVNAHIPGGLGAERKHHSPVLHTDEQVSEVP